MKPKTLKDLELKPYIIELPNGKIDVKVFLIITELRQEAVKWYKQIKENREIAPEYTLGVASFIKEFFNLTEEDIKNG